MRRKPALHESSAPHLCKKQRRKSAATCGNSPPSKHVRYVMRRLNLALLFLLLFVGDVAILGQEDQASPAPATQGSEPTSAPTRYPVDKASPSPATTTAEQPRPENPKLDLTPDANGTLSQAQMQQLFRVVADKDIDNDKRLRDYTYIERDVQNRLDGKGQVKSTETRTYQVMEIYGEQINRLIQKDDKPLSEKDAAKEEKKVQKIIDKRKNESESDRKKREQKEEKDREEGRKFVREVADAYNFKLVGSELVGGREAWVIHEALVDAIRQYGNGILETSATGIGMYLVAYVAPDIDDRLAARIAYTSGVDTVPLSTFSVRRLRRGGLVLGYSAYDAKSIRAATTQLCDAISNVASGPHAIDFTNEPINREATRALLFFSSMSGL